jgi:uncharacterized membrane protein
MRTHTTSSVRRYRKDRGFGFLILVAVLAAILVLPFHAWLLMLCIGALHSGWINAIPTIGFGSALVLSFMLGIVGIILKGSSGSKSG